MILLVTGHLLRTMRWRIVLFHCGVEVSNLRPFTALSLGYLLNMLLPFRMGDFVRVAILSRSARAKFSTVAASVVTERLIDLFAVAALALAISVETKGLLLGVLSLSLGILLFVVIYTVHQHAVGRRVVWILASVFNDEIKSGILNFFYVLSSLVFARTLQLSVRFWFVTALMWLSYFTSLIFLGRAFNIEPSNLFQTIYVSALQIVPALVVIEQNNLLVGYLLFPLLLALSFVGAARGGAVFRPFFRLLQELTDLRRFSRSPVVPRSQLFVSSQHYDSFLGRHYSGTGGLLSQFEDRGINSARLLRMFHGGSGAITALVEVVGELRVRKFAIGGLGEKLKTQCEWLMLYQERLPLVNVIETWMEGSDFSYDMAYVGGSRDLYEAIHTEATDNSTRLITEVIDALEGFHIDTQVAEADDETVSSYLKIKVVNNYAVIREEFSDIFELGSIEINGSLFQLSELDIFSSPDWLEARLTDRRQSVIHGDLTIENIMINGTGDQSWFLIDPNPDNGFQTPFIDFAKLMQSLHLGYEALRSAPRSKLSGNVLLIGIHRSYQYDVLYDHYTAELRARFGEDGFKQILLHEWINYLRLIPYQLRENREAGLAFFGCLCLLVSEYKLAYPEEFL